MEGKSKSPKKLPRKKIENYSTCMLFDAVVAQQKLQSITIAACNPSLEDDGVKNLEDTESDREPAHHHHKKKHVVSDKMNCNCCSVEFASRSDQRDHYKSDWHRYNIKLRLKEESTISEEEFEKISGDVSSISGSEGDSDLSDTETDTSLGGGKGKSKPVAIPSHLQPSAHSGTDSESEGGGILEVTKRKYPKIYFRNEGGELISLFRCLLFHKKRPPNNQSEIITLASSLPQRMKWAVFMAAGGHFAASIFDGEKILAHKTFHRYVVRAKRGSAQSSRDGQGNAPKSAGASLRRYNEAALAQDVQELISSWSELIKKCDLIFLRAPSFNRQIFYGGKNPSFKKDDFRIRTIPFPTRRPTLNEIKRVHQMLASIECYGMVHLDQKIRSLTLN